MRLVAVSPGPIASFRVSTRLGLRRQNSLPEQPPRTASRSTMVRPGLHLPPSFLAWLAPFLAGAGNAAVGRPACLVAYGTIKLFCIFSAVPLRSALLRALARGRP